ncbi:MAG TPA: CoA transferase [Povalibacter sp.]|uniref:CaiB/BaiF CoA-transferase family protein n=1 Tax=Povalibacter sp. TaxID=1962978 RepID=UPI002C6E79F6|nr:CoA transferase [Povalibacter sp.]HMN45694.1 CoA transferase [Povalibacter sp.]
MSEPLQGLRVLECGDDVAVRYAGRLFRALGAQVHQVAAPSTSMIGYGEECGRAYGDWLDAGKQRGAFSGRFDFVLAGLDPACVKRAERLAEEATLIAMTWFDPEGPYAGWRGSDEIIAALGGTAFLFGPADGPPMLPQGHGPQVTTGLIAFIAALATLFAPRRGRRIDINVLEAALCYAENGALAAQETGVGAPRLGINRYVPTYPCAPYRTSDGWIGLTCLTPAQWRALCRLIDREDLLDDPRFATAHERLMIADEVDRALAPVIAGRTQREWIELGIANRIPIAPVDHPGDLPALEHWRERNAFARFDESGVAGPTLPYRIRHDGASAPAWRSDSVERPLGGLRVVDFSMGWAGPLCARTLADFGADVVKIECEIRPDWWRGWEAGTVDPTTRERQFNFINVNRNKRGIDLNLATPEGRQQAETLIAAADVVVENFAAGVLQKLDLGQSRQRQLRPGIISLSMPAFGNGGPLSGLRAYGSTVEQASGLLFVNGEASWPPCQQHIALGDPIAGLYGASAILAALYARPRLGGADIDLAQVACLFQVGADAIIAEQVRGSPVPRTGHARARLPLCCVVAAREPDTWLAVAAPDETTIERLADAVGGRGIEALQAWTTHRTAQAAAEALQAMGVPAAPVNPSQVLLHDAQLSGRGYFIEMERAFVGRHLVAASPFRIDGARPPLQRPAPLLGEHSAEVAAELNRLGGIS